MTPVLRSRLTTYLKLGPRAATLRLAKRTLAPWLEWGSLLFIEEELRRSPAPAAAERPSAREVGLADVPALASTFGRDPSDLRARLARGDRAFAAFDSNQRRPLHVRWASVLPTAIPEAGLWIRPGPGEVYLYDVLTHPLHRGNRISQAVREAMDPALVAAGHRRKVGYVRGDNRSMLRAIEHGRVQLRPLFRIHYLRRPDREPVVVGSFRPPVYRQPR